MNKEIYESIADRIGAEVSALRWIDLDNGQFESPDRPSVAFPACLIDMAYPLCEDNGETVQNVTCQVTLRVAFLLTGPTSNTNTEVRSASLAIFQVIEDIHTALQNFYTDQLGSFSRRSVVPERRNDGIKVYRMVYQSVFEEDTAE
jgi:hypothetical protein